VTLLVRIENGKAMRLAYVEEHFEPNLPDNDSSSLRGDEILNELFAGKALADLNGMDEKHLAGTTGVTKSGEGLIAAVKNALAYEFTEEAA
ncbi:MAG: hypothetical protein K2L51_07565, partial [Clostridiales bacterium]|nr:hypothetical protein [Clostridiales bacterium]